MKMEDQILMLYYSVFPLVSGSVNHSISCLYTVLIAEIILRYSNKIVYRYCLTMSTCQALREDVDS